MLPHATIADIPADIRAQILARLDDLARSEQVRVVLAVESGSRAWGFASADSDYDVRFLYVRRVEDYAALSVPRDVIERPIEGALDLGGWDLRTGIRRQVIVSHSTALTYRDPHCHARASKRSIHGCYRRESESAGG